MSAGTIPLGGASFKVQADASAFTAAMQAAQAQAAATARSINTQVDKIADTYEVLAVSGRGYEVLARRVASAQEKARAAAAELAAVEARMRQTFEGLSHAADRSSKAVAAAGRSGGMGAMGFLYLSQAIEDAQYGFGSIVNNIPMLVMAMGGSAGVAGAASIAAVAVNTLLHHWHDLELAMQSSWSGTPVAELKRIEQQARESAAAFDELMDRPTRAMAAQREGIAEVFREGPLKDIQARLAARVAVDLPSRSQLLNPLNPNAQADADKARAAEVREARMANARKLMEPALSTDPAISAAAIAHIKAIDLEIGKALEHATPAGKEAIAQRYLELQGFKQGRDMAARLKREADDERVQQKRWEIEGREYGKAWARKREDEARAMAARMMQSPMGAAMFGPKNYQGNKGLITQTLLSVGSDLAPDAVRKAMVELRDEEIRRRQVERGVTRERAKQELMLENVMRNNPDFGRRRPPGEPSSFIGLADFAKHIQTGALDVPRQQLNQAQETNRLLRLLLNKNPAPGPAVAVGPN